MNFVPFNALSLKLNHVRDIGWACRRHVTEYYRILQSENLKDRDHQCKLQVYGTVILNRDEGSRLVQLADSSGGLV